MSKVLFNAATGPVTDEDVNNALLSCGAADCDVLYAHTGLTFGLPAIRRGLLLAELLSIFENLGVETLVFPTFTFSFCNNEPYDVQKSPTPMGAINEFARKTGRGSRSQDPLLSIYVLGKNPGLTENLSEYSIGRGSSYDKLHNCGKSVKFLFFGADIRECFTYTHYMEALIGVPYRYNREFTGKITDKGQERQARAFLYSTYANCVLNPVPIVHDLMQKRGLLYKQTLGDSSVCCLSEKDGYDTIAELIHANPYCLTDGNFDPAKKDSTYNRNGGRILSVR